MNTKGRYFYEEILLSLEFSVAASAAVRKLPEHLKPFFQSPVLCLQGVLDSSSTPLAFIDRRGGRMVMFGCVAVNPTVGAAWRQNTKDGTPDSVCLSAHRLRWSRGKNNLLRSVCVCFFNSLL